MKAGFGRFSVVALAILLVAHAAGCQRVLVANPGWRDVPATPLAGAEQQEAGKNDYTVRCRDFAPAYAEQHYECWCWLACAEMIHDYAGRPTSQEELAKKIIGEKDPKAASSHAGSYLEVLRALAPETELDIATALDRITERVKRLDGGQIGGRIELNHLVSAAHRATTANSDRMLSSIQSGKPVVALLKAGGAGGAGHAVLITGVRYSHAPGRSWVRERVDQQVDAFAGSTARYYGIISVDVADPWYVADERITTLTGQELADRVDVLVTSDEARLILSELNEGARTFIR